MRILSKIVRTVLFNNHNMPTLHEKTQTEFFFCKIVVISQVFRIFAKYSERYFSRSTVRAIRIRAGMFMEYFPNVFFNSGESTFLRIFLFPTVKYYGGKSYKYTISPREEREKREEREELVTHPPSVHTCSVSSSAYYKAVHGFT